MNQSSITEDKRPSEKATCPLVSVVVPAYNHEDYISDCILSILEQDYPNIDLIVINDGSTDKTDQKIKEIFEKNPARFRYVSKKNEGLIKTLNLGLKLAKGEFFCELASDDIFMPGSIRKRVDYLIANTDIDAVFADAYCLQGNDATDIMLGAGKKRYKSSENTIIDLIEGGVIIIFPTGMFRKSIIERLGGFDEDFRYYEDVAMKYQLAIHAKIGYLNEPVMYHRRHGGNTSTVNRFRVRKEKILALKKIYPVENRALNKCIRKNLYKEKIKYVKAMIRRYIGLQQTFFGGLYSCIL